MTRSLILVIGGTRGVGREVVQRLAARGERRVRVLARDPARARRDLPAGVEIRPGDLTQPQSLGPAIEGTSHIVFIAGVPSGTYASENLVRRTDYDGVLHTLTAARQQQPPPRLLYLNSMGVDAPSPAGALINTLKRNTLVWRRRVEADIRASGIRYTIIRVGFLVDKPVGRRDIALSQDSRPLAVGKQIARADVAEAFIAALDDANTVHATFDIVWGRGRRRENWADLFSGLRPDS